MCVDRWKNQVDISLTQKERKNDRQLFLLFSLLAAIAELLYICVCVYVYVVCLRLARSFYMKRCACPFTAAAALWHIVMQYKERERGEEEERILVCFFPPIHRSYVSRQ